MADRYREAKALLLGANKVSASYIQRKLYIGWNEATCYVDRMEAEGFVSRPNSAGLRTLLRDFMKGEGQ